MKSEALPSDVLARIDAVAREIKAGKLAIIPTETVYGLVGDPVQPGTKELIYEAKGRDADRPIAVLVDGTDAVRKMGGTVSAAAELLADRYWPGPLTLILPAGQGYDGYRVPDHAVALALLEAVGGALYATSANRSGSPPALTMKQALDELGASVNVVLDAGAEPCGTPSTVVKVDGDQVEVLRVGVLTVEEIEACAAGN